MQYLHSIDANETDSEPAQNDLRGRLAPDENVLSTLTVDLDHRLCFSRGLVALTDRRLWAYEANPPTGEGQWRSWPLGQGLALHHFDHAGVGTIELHDAHTRRASWRFTLGANVQALRLIKQFELQLATLAQGAAQIRDNPSLCPQCKSPLPPDSDECPLCARELQTPPSTWVLLRLGRFARPYRKQLIAGFALTLVSTAATLIPPYLTIPLMDDVLIPFQDGREIQTSLVAALLGGLLASSLLGWALGWARTYILSLVSERIGADLRTATFDHLLSLSLDYFGGKRTGDLMARIGSETDRICVFLSLHALDFATDVLMLLMPMLLND